MNSKLVLTALLLATLAGCSPAHTPLFATGDIVYATRDKEPTPGDVPLGLVYEIQRRGDSWTYVVAFQGHAVTCYERGMRKLGHLDWSKLGELCEPPRKCTIPIVPAPTAGLAEHDK